MKKVAVTIFYINSGEYAIVKVGAIGYILRPHTSLQGARSLWSTAADDRDDPPIPRWDESMRAEG